MSDGKVHSKIGASSMYRWSACAGSVALCEKMPPQTSSKYAEEGTLAHDIASRMILKTISSAEMAMVDPEMMDAVQVYVDYVEGLWADIPRHEKSVRLIEHEFNLEKVYPGLFGTCDAVIYDGKNKRLHVIDYKHGSGIEVHPEGNPQLMYYGIGALMSLSVPIVEIELVIVQPRIEMANPIKGWEISPMELLEFSADLVEYAKATEKEDAPIVSGSHCHFCTAQPICPVKRSEASVAVKAAFAEEEFPKLSPEELGDLLSVVDRIESWCGAVRSFGYNEAKAGRTPKGWKIVPKLARRKWADAESAQKVFEKNLQSTIFMDLLNAPELKSPAQVEKVLGKTQKELVDSLTVSISSGDKLVLDSHPSDAIDSLNRGIAMFGDT